MNSFSYILRSETLPRLINKVWFTGILFVLMACAPKNEVVQKPNVLLIILDDQNDWIGYHMGTDIKTPNIDRLANRSIVFSNAFCSAPGCTPSRTSFLTGLSPSTSGVYFNNQSYRKSNTWIKDIVNLPQLFQMHGYTTAGYGKVFHHTGDCQELDRQSWTEGYYVPFNVESDFSLKRFASNIKGLRNHYYSWGALPDSWDREDTSRMQQDTRNSNLVIDLLDSEQRVPFFIALGLWKPHLPWYVPRRYFDLYDLEESDIPMGFLEDDLDDVPFCAQWIATKRAYHREMLDSGFWKPAIQAYRASISYADNQVGRVLSALDRSSYRDNTIVFLIGDNGWHLGEKQHWSKFTLWEQANKVPLIMSIPGQEHKIIQEPVSLLDLFPTMQRLCGLPDPPTHVPEGKNLLLLLEKQRGASYAISTHGKGNHSVRTLQYRYIRYRNGAEELYDHFTDPFEWDNLADQLEFRMIMDSLASLLPDQEAENIVFDGGDESSFGWENWVFER